jgi:hypothetical protein
LELLLLILFSDIRCILLSKYLVDFLRGILNGAVTVGLYKELCNERLENLPLIALESQLILGLYQRPVNALQNPLHDCFLLTLLLLCKLLDLGDSLLCARELLAFQSID